MPMIEAIQFRLSLSQLAQRIKTTYLPRGAAVLVRGAPGASKSATAIALIREFQAQHWDFGGCYFNGGNGQSVDLSGWPVNNGSLVSTNAVPALFQPVRHLGLRGAFPALCPKHLVHKDTPKDHLPVQQPTLDDLTTYSKGIAILDEVGNLNSEADFATASMFAHEGRTGQWGVPVDGWCRILITNRQEDRSNVLSFPSTFENRIACVDVRTTYEDMAPYWTSIGMHPWFMGFAAANPSLVLSDTVPQDGGQFGTARSWTEAWSDVMAYCENELSIPHQENKAEWPCYYPDEEMLATMLDTSNDDADVRAWANQFIGLVAARCGGHIAGQFADYVSHMGDRPTYDQIIDDPANAPLPNHPGVLHYVIEMLLSEVHLDDMDSIVTYMERPAMPRALASIWCQRMVKEHPFAVVKNRAFTRLMNALGQGARFALDGA